MTTKYIASIDQGTTSTRCILFNHSGMPVAQHQMEHRQIFPQAGWVEHDATEIWENTRSVIAGALARADITSDAVVAVGITNQRETVVVWDRVSGQPVYNAIVWQDTRTAGICEELARDGGTDRFAEKTGLPLATYFSGPKVRWILDNVPGARARADNGDLMFGTMDTWITYQLTGGPHGGVHVTDPTNASRTLLMDLATLEWDPEIAAAIGVPLSMLPKIVSSSEVYGTVGPRSALAGCPGHGHPGRPAGRDLRAGLPDPR